MQFPSVRVASPATSSFPAPSRNGSFGDGEGSDPVISEDSMLNVDNRYVLAGYGERG